MKSVLRGYFMSLSDIQLAEELLRSVPDGEEAEDAATEVLSILESKTPIYIQMEDDENV